MASRDREFSSWSNQTNDYQMERFPEQFLSLCARWQHPFLVQANPCVQSLTLSSMEQREKTHTGAEAVSAYRGQFMVSAGLATLK